MSIKRIHHAAYRCNDADETVTFYRDLLGFFESALGEQQADQVTPHFGDLGRNRRNLRRGIGPRSRHCRRYAFVGARSWRTRR